DAASVLDRCGARIRRARAIVEATASRPGHTGCFGLHEWAMLYRTSPEEVRHRGLPLRLTHDQIDEVVRGSRLRCTHFDAFRFFTDPAAPLNQTRLTRDDQVRHEQPACLHAGMDVYSWVTKMEAGAPGALLLDSLRAAFDAREVDMRSSPYDLSRWGLDPLPVETAEGRPSSWPSNDTGSGGQAACARGSSARSTSSRRAPPRTSGAPAGPVRRGPPRTCARPPPPPRDRTRHKPGPRRSRSAGRVPSSARGPGRRTAPPRFRDRRSRPRPPTRARWSRRDRPRRTGRRSPARPL